LRDQATIEKQQREAVSRVTYIASQEIVSLQADEMLQGLASLMGIANRALVGWARLGFELKTVFVCAELPWSHLSMVMTIAQLGILQYKLRNNKN
jgi:hypothetical protein